MNADNPARPYPIGTVARMVLLVVGLGYMAVGGCWVWVNREYAALMVVAFGFLPLAAVCWHSRLMVRGFLIGCCLSVFLLALQFTRALFGEYKTSIHPIFWAFPVLATPLPLGFWILVRWLDQDQPWVPKSPPAFPLKLSDGGEDAENEAAIRGGRIHAIMETHEINSQATELLQCVHQLPQTAGEPVISVRAA